MIKIETYKIPSVVVKTQSIMICDACGNEIQDISVDKDTWYELHHKQTADHEPYEISKYHFCSLSCLTRYMKDTWMVI